MKFLTISDYGGMLETELFAQQYRIFGLETVRHPVVRVTGRVVPYGNGRGVDLDVIRVEPGEPKAFSNAAVAH